MTYDDMDNVVDTAPESPFDKMYRVGVSLLVAVGLIAASAALGCLMCFMARSGSPMPWAAIAVFSAILVLFGWRVVSK